MTEQPTDLSVLTQKYANFGSHSPNGRAVNLLSPPPPLPPLPTHPLPPHPPPPPLPLLLLLLPLPMSLPLPLPLKHRPSATGCDRAVGYRLGSKFITTQSAAAKPWFLFASFSHVHVRRLDRP